MSKKKYPSIFSPQMEAIVFIILVRLLSQHTYPQYCFENWEIFSVIPQFQLGNIHPCDAFRPIPRAKIFDGL